MERPARPLMFLSRYGILFRHEIPRLERMDSPARMKTPSTPPPNCCYIEVTSRCNLQCRLCGQSLYPGPRGDMSLGTFERLEPIFSRTTEVALFGAGEPLLHPHYFSMLERVKAHGNLVYVTTNGTLLDEATCRKIVRGGIDILSISVDGACAATFNHLRRGADFDRVVENIRRTVMTRESMGSARPRVTFNFVATRLNLPELPELVRLAHRLKVDRISVAPLIEWDRIREETIRAPEKGLRHIELAGALAGELGIGLDVSPAVIASIREREEGRRSPDAPAPPAGGPRRKLCSAPWEMIQVNLDGGIRPCCFPSRVLGDINKEGFDTLWDGPAYTAFRRKLRSGTPPDECVGCAARPWSDPIPSALDMEETVSGQLGGGWHAMEKSTRGTAFRWMGKRASFYINHTGGGTLRMTLFSHPACVNPPLRMEIRIDGEAVRTVVIAHAKPQEVAVDLGDLPRGLVEVELTAGSTFIPARCIRGSSDTRELSIALCSAKTA